MKINDVQYNIERELELIEESLTDQSATFSKHQIENFFKELWETLSLTWNKLKERLLEVKMFQEQITKERTSFLLQKKEELLKKKAEYWERYQVLDEEREQLLQKIKESNTLKKFAQKELVISELSNQLKKIDESLATFRIIAEQSKALQDVNTKIKHLADSIQRQTKRENYPSFFTEIVDIFTSAYQKAIGEENELPMLFVSKNKEGNVDFFCKVYNTIAKERLEITDGHTMMKTICAIFVLAILIVYAKNNLRFFRFAYHDWVLDWAWKPVKRAFVEETKKLSEEYGIQYIISVIKTDFKKTDSLISNNIILTLSEDKPLFWITF